MNDVFGQTLGQPVGPALELPLSRPSGAGGFVPETGLSIVVPVYNGAATVEKLVAELSRLTVAGGLEIILVNDGSPDNSGDICRALLETATVPLTYVEHARNFGE